MKLLALLASLVVCGAVLAGCPRHTGGPNTPHGNDLILSKEGIPSFTGQTQRCPSQNGEGTIELTFDNGKKRVAGRCKGGLTVGDWKAWYTNGAVVWKASFEHGRLTGEFESWYANDQKMAEVDFKDGVPHGTMTSWWYNGKKRAKGKYVGGKKNGCWETWHDNGQKATKGTYANDRKVLTWLHWTPSGKKSKQKLGGEAVHGKCLITF